MKSQLWSKALLKSYSNLEIIARQIDVKVETLALSSPGARLGNTTEIVANKILKYVDKKIMLCKTKVLIEDVLMKINSKYATVLKMRYVEKLEYEKIAEYFGVSVRTVRRYLFEGIKYFSLSLKEKRYPPRVLAKIYKDEDWLGRAYLSALKAYLKSQGKKEYQKFVETTLKGCKINSYETIYSYEIKQSSNCKIKHIK